MAIRIWRKKYIQAVLNTRLKRLQLYKAYIKNDVSYEI